MIIPNKKNIWILLTMVFLLLLGVGLRVVYHQSKLPVCQGSTCFDLEVANTPLERERGLMYRETRKGSQGMLFIFPQEDYYDFRMKNTKLPLDIIRIDKDKHIVDIQEANPCIQMQCFIYHPVSPAMYVLEFPQGTAKNNLRKEGMQFSF